MRFCKASSLTMANCTVVGAGVDAWIAVNKRIFYSECGNIWEATRCNKRTQSEHASHVLFPFLSLARCPWLATGSEAHQCRTHALLSNPIIFTVHFQIIRSYMVSILTNPSKFYLLKGVSPNMLHSLKNKQKQKEKGKETCSRLQAIEEKTRLGTST